MIPSNSDRWMPPVPKAPPPAPWACGGCEWGVRFVEIVGQAHPEEPWKEPERGPMESYLCQNPDLREKDKPLPRMTWVIECGFRKAVGRP